MGSNFQAAAAILKGPPISNPRPLCNITNFDTHCQLKPLQKCSMWTTMHIMAISIVEFQDQLGFF